jgi:CDP-diacylglycerol--serine O-phosphatidyltransferase
MVARLLKQQSELGKQLDSLADMVSFGVAPGMVMMVYLAGLSNVHSDGMNLNSISQSYENWSDIMFHDGGQLSSLDYLPFLALLIPVFSMLRLAKFNIDTRQSESFIGLPTPGNALFFMSFPLITTFSAFEVENANFLEVLIVQPLFVGLLIAVMSWLLISEIPLFSFKMKNLKWKGNEVRFIFIVLSVIFILIFKVWSISIIVFLYLILSIVIAQQKKK